LTVEGGGIPTLGRTEGDAPSSAQSEIAPTKVVVSFNPELVMRAQQDPAAAEALLEADLCYPDGVGAVWAAGRQGARGVVGSSDGSRSDGSLVSGGRRSSVERVAGIDLAQRVLELAAEQGVPVFFLGAAPGVAEVAVSRQLERVPALQVSGVHHGYFAEAEDNDVVAKVRASGARIVLVAMGAPRQEILLHRHRHYWGAAVGLGVGGSFDVWAGVVERAPGWAQRARVEWLYRLVTDPRRARRQASLPRFVADVVRWAPDDYGPPRRGRARGAA
jgi:N-acetylglucosaminyldiphosphoundecaprenol N-acetyl-beta-D-mannosaminyltransferase